MPKVVDHPSIPPHTPIVPCPTCGRHTAHTMPVMGSYRCEVCGASHTLMLGGKGHEEPEAVWCPSCREWSNFWAPVQGRRQCRACLSWIEVDAWLHDAAERGA
jgi:hypothetical protein